MSRSALITSSRAGQPKPAVDDTVVTVPPGLEPFEHRLGQLPDCQSVYRQHHVGGCRAGHSGHVHQSVEPTFELLDGGLDTARIRQVDLDVAG